MKKNSSEFEMKSLKEDVDMCELEFHFNDKEKNFFIKSVAHCVFNFLFNLKNIQKFFDRVLKLIF
jgi:hypothetical protein